DGFWVIRVCTVSARNNVLNAIPVSYTDNRS
ncbi:hypothetical protein D046_8502, partial [Vibrio parahaemolyticus V-223/04]